MGNLRSWGRAAFGGLAAAAVALGVAEPLSALTGRGSGPVLAVGAAMVDRTPESLKEFAIKQFGTHDKQVLLGSLAVGVAVLAVVIGLVARRHPRLGVLGMAAFGLLGAWAAITRPTSSPVDVLPSLVGAVAGAFTLLFLRSYAEPRPAAPVEPHPSGASGEAPPKPPVMIPGGSRFTPLRANRRGFLVASAGALGVAAAGGLLGRVLDGRRDVESARQALRFPAPVKPAAPLPKGADLRIPGLSSFVTPNKDFYRVDTNLTLPQVDPEDWTLKVSGMVDRPFEIGFDELLRRPLIEHDITLTCVSNEVGGPYVGNARWLGASLPALLREAGVRSGADQLLSESIDGFTVGTPLSTVLDGRESLIAVAMNGEALPVAHGFPARLVVPGVYGYASATKWVVELKVTRFTDEKAYWVERGYVENAPIKTLTRIDVPKPLQQVKAGRQMVAGMAWAQHRGIAAVEVRVDGGQWHEAQLAAVPNTDTWRQWVWQWDAAPGLHTLEARATDATGATQPEKRVPLFPDGATGWHSSVVTVS